MQSEARHRLSNTPPHTCSIETQPESRPFYNEPTNHSWWWQRVNLQIRIGARKTVQKFKKVQTPSLKQRLTEKHQAGRVCTQTLSDVKQAFPEISILVIGVCNFNLYNVYCTTSSTCLVIRTCLYLVTKCKLMLSLTYSYVERIL